MCRLLARRKTNDEATARRLLVIEKQVENIVRTVRQLFPGRASLNCGWSY